MSFFDCDGLRLMLTVPERSGGEPKGKGVVTGEDVHAVDDHPRRVAHGNAVYFTVSDVSRTTDELRSRGVRFIGEPHVVHRTNTYDLWMSFFIDPDGNTLALMAEVPK